MLTAKTHATWLPLPPKPLRLGDATSINRNRPESHGYVPWRNPLCSRSACLQLPRELAAMEPAPLQLQRRHPTVAAVVSVREEQIIAAPVLWTEG